MRRVVLWAMLALALPTAALADTIDYANVGSIGTTATVTGTATAGSSLTVVSQLTQITDLTTNVISPASGWVTVSTGTLTATAISNIFTFTGGSITIKSGATTLFSGAFTSGTVISLGNGQFSLTAMTGGGVAFTTQLDANHGISGDTIVTPEPGTLGLLGTGLLGLAGIVRRKLRG
jgi:PEP-CTERM motif